MTEKKASSSSSRPSSVPCKEKQGLSARRGQQWPDPAQTLRQQPRARSWARGAGTRWVYPNVGKATCPHTVLRPSQHPHFACEELLPQAGPRALCDHSRLPLPRPHSPSTTGPPTPEELPPAAPRQVIWMRDGRKAHGKETTPLSSPCGGEESVPCQLHTLCAKGWHHPSCSEQRQPGKPRASHLLFSQQAKISLMQLSGAP